MLLQYYKYLGLVLFLIILIFAEASKLIILTYVIYMVKEKEKLKVDYNIHNILRSKNENFQ